MTSSSVRPSVRPSNMVWHTGLVVLLACVSLLNESVGRQRESGGAQGLEMDSSSSSSSPAAAEEELTLTVKWSGKEYTVRVCGDDSVGELKRRICELTNVLPKRQKLLYPKVGSKLADDSVLLSQLPLKSSLKMTMIGSLFLSPPLSLLSLHFHTISLLGVLSFVFS